MEQQIDPASQATRSCAESVAQALVSEPSAIRLRLAVTHIVEAAFVTKTSLLEAKELFNGYSSENSLLRKALEESWLQPDSNEWLKSIGSTSHSKMKCDRLADEALNVLQRAFRQSEVWSKTQR